MNSAMYLMIQDLADHYAIALKEKVDRRIQEMKCDDTSHYLIYRILGITVREGQFIDIYQNKGRFLYKYAGDFLEEAAFLCFKHQYPEAEKIKILNPFGSRPKTFEIDCLTGKFAHEIKWRDATTDGDHITKEHTRVQAIHQSGYIPVRVMFYYPQREQAQRVQETLKTLYHGIGGKYYCGDSAWQYIKEYTGVDLLAILQQIAVSREKL